MAPPIIVVPGFGGSQLRGRLALAPLEVEVWINELVLASWGFAAMRLGPDGFNPYYTFGPALRAGSHVSWYYPTLCDSLRAAGWDVWAGPSDWRKKLAESVLALVDMVKELSKGGPVPIVAHSRGGLVALQAVLALQATGELSRVSQVITLGTPYGGSYLPIGYLAGWASTVRQVWGALFLGYSALGLPWFTPEVLATLQSWPGMYELLPDPNGAGAAQDPDIPALYSPSTWTLKGVQISTAHLASAKARWDNPPLVPSGVEWRCLVGTGVSTPGPLAPFFDVSRPDCLYTAVDGDGVVPIWSALASKQAVWKLPLTHDQLVTDGSALSLVQTLLRS